MSLRKKAQEWEAAKAHKDALLKQLTAIEEWRRTWTVRVRFADLWMRLLRAKRRRRSLHEALS